jgi:hypothetical protein
MKTSLSWDVMRCIFLEDTLIPCRRRQQVPPKRWYLYNKLYGFTSQATGISVFTAAQSEPLTQHLFLYGC